MHLFNRLYLRQVLPWLEPSRYAGAWRYMDAFRNAERKPLAENKEEQWKQVQELLSHAYRTTAYYRRVFDEAGITPDSIQSSADFPRIPLLTRSAIKKNPDSLISSEFDRAKLLPAATGGTTDSPVPLLRDEECLRIRNAAQLNFNSWAGLDPGDKVFWLWGAQVDFAADPSWRWRMADRYLYRRVWAPTSLLNASVFSTYVERLERFRPKVIMAYPTPLALFAEYIIATKTPVHSPHACICTAEPLTAEQRTVISEAFRCPVYGQYGTRDFGLVGSECEEHDGFHLNPFSVFVELVPIEGSRELFDLIVTDLTNRSFPMIRYKINDCVRPISQDCPCGRGFPKISTIVGRTTENFVLPNGDVVPGVAVTNRVIKVCPGIEKIQIEQRSEPDFLIRYQKGTTFSADDLESLQRGLRAFFGDVAYTFQEVAEIPREASGKTRLCISHVSKARVG
jgi:phenylacetate-CoA ligase